MQLLTTCLICLCAISQMNGLPFELTGIDVVQEEARTLPEARLKGPKTLPNFGVAEIVDSKLRVHCQQGFRNPPPDAQKVRIEYTVRVPMQRSEVIDGKTTSTVYYEDVKRYRETVTFIDYEIGVCKTSTADETLLADLAIESTLASQQPVIILEHGQPLDPAIRKLLDPKALIIQLPDPSSK